MPGRIKLITHQTNRYGPQPCQVGERVGMAIFVSIQTVLREWVQIVTCKLETTHDKSHNG